MFRRILQRLFLLLTFCAVFEQQTSAQDYPTLLQYVTNMQTINPAYVGIWDKSVLLLSTRTNWVGINGAPVTQYINYSTPVKEQKSGLGISLQRVVIGQEKKIFLTGDYSYRLRMDMTHYLQLGFRAGIVNYDNNLKNYQPYPDYIPDPNIVLDVKMHNMTVFGIGAVYFSENYYLSLSIPQIIGNTFKVNQTNFMSSSDYKTLYISTGYIFGTPGRVRIRPNLMLAGAKGQPVYGDVGGIVYLPPVLQFGLNIRSTGLVCIFSQYQLSDRLKIGYAIDYSVTSDIRRFQLGTHEIFVGYDFNVYKRKSTRTNYF